MSDKSRNYYMKNRERVREVNKIYYDKNREMILTKVKKYQKTTGSKKTNKYQTFDEYELDDLTRIEDFSVKLTEDGIIKIIQAF